MMLLSIFVSQHARYSERIVYLVDECVDECGMKAFIMKMYLKGPGSFGLEN